MNDTPDNHGKKVFALIDGKSVFYRGYYAMPHLTTKDGKPTGGVYGFASLALELVRRIKPDYVAVAWDKPKTNIRRRKAIYDGYKANRHPAPADFYEQVPILHNLLKDLGWPLYEMDDYEADDIMGTLSTEANQLGIHTILISSDLDMLQLIDDDTEVYALKKGLSNLEKFDVSAFEAKYGISVNQFLDLKSLKGDNSDNIPGVPGVGEKTAIKLLQQYQTLDGVYNHLNEIGGSVKNKLIKGKDSAYMSQQLAKIWCDAPIPFDQKSTDANNLDRSKLHKTLLDLEFTSLIRRLPDNMQLAESTPIDLATRDVEIAIPKVLVQSTVYSVIKSALVKVSNLVIVLSGQDIIISPSVDIAYKIGLNQIGDLLSGKSVVVHDAKLLARTLLSYGQTIDFNVEFDTKHAAFLINSLSKTTDLPSYLSGHGLEDTDSNRVFATWSLYNDQAANLRSKSKLNWLAHEVDFPLQIVLAKMEQRGVGAEVTTLNDMSISLNSDIDSLQSAIWREVGYEFNISSPKQLSDALYVKLQLPSSGKRNKSGNYPTGQKELTRLASLHPVISLIEQYRELTKLKSTYVDALPKQIGSDGRIHTTLDQDVTATGRLSSSNPNLQNIPTRTERGREIKKALVASPGKVIVNADYAQFELRLAAAMAGDQKMITAFSDSQNDIHTITAAEAYGVDPDKVTSDQRRHAKVINFGVLYGMSPHGLVEATGMDFHSAQDFINRYFELRAPIRLFINRTLEQASNLGYVETMFGRRRPTPDVRSSNYIIRESAKRAAANMPIQGTEADLMKMAMLKVERDIPEASQVMQVHDSIMVECDRSQAEAVSAKMKQIMENIYPKLGVRLFVEVKFGNNWGEV